MEDKIVRVELEGVLSKDYNIETDVKEFSLEALREDEDFEYIYIVKENPTTLPVVVVKKDGVLFNTNLSIEDVLSKK